jgi:hypothetical protein
MATTAQRGLLTSLYGFDPVQRRAEQQAGLDRFLAAQQTPQARMGAALGSLFGQYLAPESEEQTRVAKVNSIYNQVMADADPTKPTEYLEKLGLLAQSFQQSGLPEQAEITIDRINKLTPKREIKEVGGVLVEIPPGKGTPTTIFTAPDREKNIKPSSDFAQAAVELGFGARPNLDDYNLNEARAINSLIEARKIKTAGAGASKIAVMGQGNVLDIDKDDAKDYRLSRQSASKALPVLTKMQSLLDSPQGIIGGTATEARTGFLKALDTLGVSTAEARKAISNTEQFNIQVRNLLQSIIKQFGYNPSNADVKFALESLPNASNSPEGLRAILNSLVKANKDQLNESTRALDYFRKNKGSFEGFTPNLDIVSPGGGPKPPSQMTDEELRSEIARRRPQK